MKEFELIVDSITESWDTEPEARPSAQLIESRLRDCSLSLPKSCFQQEQVFAISIPDIDYNSFPELDIHDTVDNPGFGASGRNQSFLSLQSEPPIPITIERAPSTISLPQNIMLPSETYTSNDESIGEYESSFSNCIQSHATSQYNSSLNSANEMQSVSSLEQSLPFLKHVIANKGNLCTPTHEVATSLSKDFILQNFSSIPMTEYNESPLLIIRKLGDLTEFEKEEIPEVLETTV